MTQPSAIEIVVDGTDKDVDSLDGDEHVDDALVCLAGRVVLNHTGQNIEDEDVGILYGIEDTQGATEFCVVTDQNRNGCHEGQDVGYEGNG